MKELDPETQRLYKAAVRAQGVLVDITRGRALEADAIDLAISALGIACAALSQPLTLLRTEKKVS